MNKTNRLPLSENNLSCTVKCDGVSVDANKALAGYLAKETAAMMGVCRECDWVVADKILSLALDEFLKLASKDDVTINPKRAYKSYIKISQET